MGLRPLLLVLTAALARAVDLSTITLPEGFRIEFYTAEGAVPNARGLALSTSAAASIVYVSTRTRSSIYAVVDTDKDGVVEYVHTLTSAYSTPTGIAYRDGALYIAQVNRVIRFDGVDACALDRTPLPAPVVLNDGFPSDASHGWKYLGIGPDDKLYVPVGAPCNVCVMESYGDIAYGTINRMNLDGSGLEVFATGIRNTVGFDWHPETGELFFTDNGRDSMGDDLPDCELNRASRAGQFFGYPYCHTGGVGDPVQREPGVGPAVPDPDLNAGGAATDCAAADSHTLAIQAVGPHTAPLGMTFYTGSMFPAAYRNAVFVAEHGSWNRASKIGYRLSVVHLDADGGAAARESFAEGWLQGQSVSGRPVDVAVMPDGALLLSDDGANVLYRISYSAPDTSAASPSVSPSASPSSAAPTGSPTASSASPTAAPTTASPSAAPTSAAPTSASSMPPTIAPPTTAARTSAPSMPPTIAPPTESPTAAARAPKPLLTLEESAATSHAGPLLIGAALLLHYLLAK